MERLSKTKLKILKILVDGVHTEYALRKKIGRNSPIYNELNHLIKQRYIESYIGSIVHKKHYYLMPKGDQYLRNLRTHTIS